MSPLAAAIQELSEEIAHYNPGTSRAPSPGTADYYKLRALALGLSYLARVQDLGVENDVAAVERIYRAGATHFHRAGVPDAVVVEKETLTPEQQKQVAEAIASGNL